MADWITRRSTTYLVLTAAFLLLISVSSSRPASAAESVNWSQINSITIQGGPDEYLNKAAELLQSHIREISGQNLSISSNGTQSNAIHLSVDPNHGHLVGKNTDAFYIRTQTNSITIVGKTPIATFHGAAQLLEELGVRWLGVLDYWTTMPDQLHPVALDEAQEPAVAYRDLEFTFGHILVYPGASEETSDWLLRNGVQGMHELQAHHSWKIFAPAYEVAQEDPTAVCYNPDGLTPKQALPYHPVVIERAKQFARDWFDRDVEGKHLSVPISPPDGNMIWCDEWRVNGSYDSTTITNHVFELTNEVARMLQEEYPGKYASVMSYSWYSNVPTIDLEPNVYVQIVDFGRGEQDFAERIEGFKSHELVGIKDFIDVWEWWKDRIPPAGKIDVLLGDLIAGGTANHDAFVAKVSDGWAAKGRVYWLASKLMWDPSLSTQSLLDEYYAAAFGPAETQMRRFYYRFDTRQHSGEVYALGFQDLQDAHAIALQHGDADLINRIEDVIYYTYFWWMWGEHASELYKSVNSRVITEEIYSFVEGIKSRRIITYLEHSELLEEILTRWYRLSENELSSLAAQPLAPASQILANALSQWQGQTIVDAPRIDLDTVPLAAFGQGSSFDGTSLGGWINPRVLVQVDEPGVLQLTVAMNRSYGDNVIVSDTAGDIVAEFPFNGTECPCVFNLPVAEPGRYYIEWWRHFTSVAVNHPAALDLGRPFSGLNSTYWQDGGTVYFYVPAETPVFTMQLTEGTVQLVDPNGNQLNFAAPSATVTNPAAGLWSMQFSGIGSPTITLLGIPALAWHDPNQLLAAMAPYSAFFNNDLVRPADETLEDGISNPSATQVPQPTATPTQAPQPTATPTPAPQATATPAPAPAQGGSGGGFAAPPPPPTPSVVAPVVRQPGAPSAIDVEPGDKQLTFTITRPEDDGGAQILGYRILDQETGSASRHDLQAFQYFDEKFTIVLSGLENGVLKSFAVKAYNEAGFGPAAVVGPVAPGLPESPEPVEEPVVTPTPTTVAPPLFGAAEEPPTEETEQVEPTATPITVVPIPTPTPTPTPIPVPTQAPVPTATPRSAPTQAPSVSTSEPEEIVVPTTGELITQEIEVESGWNLISFRVVPEDTQLADVLEPLFDVLEEVKIVNNGVTLSLTKDELEDSNIILDPMIGYWTRVSESATFEVDGLEVDPTVELILTPGWTVISYLPDEAMTPAEALASIAGKYDEVRALDGEASTFLPDLPAEFNTLLLMEPGQGYMIHITEEAVLSFP